MQSNAKDSKKTTSEVENPYANKYQKGFHYYDDPSSEDVNKSASIQEERQEGGPQSVQKIQPKGVEALLLELLKEAKKQTAIQKDILRVLKDTYDPEPILIKKQDGSTCIANSSADCFLMPVTPEAKKVPVLVKLLREQTIDNAAEYERWQAEYLSKIFDIGNALQFAIAQYGTQAYPLGFQRPTFDSTTGAYEQIREKHRAKIVQQKKEVQYEIYLGDNVDMDIYAMDNIAALLSYLPETKFTLVFKNEASYKVFNEGAKTFINFMKAIKKGNFATKVSPQQYKAENIQTTPTFAAVYQKDGKRTSTPIATGRVEPSQFVDLAIQLMEFEGKIKRADSVDYKAWQDSGEYSKEHLKLYYGIDLDKAKIKGFYNGN